MLECQNINENKFKKPSKYFEVSPLNIRNSSGICSISDFNYFCHYKSLSISLPIFFNVSF